MALPEDKRLDRQQAYQHFHIGIYLSLATAIMGASFFSGDKVQSLWLGQKVLLFAAVLFLLLAGACGGMVASRIPRSKCYEAFSDIPYGPTLHGKTSDGRWPRWDAKVWESYEHLFFWIAMLILMIFTLVFLFFAGAAPVGAHEGVVMSVTS